MMTFLYGIPPLALLVLALAVAIALACGGQMYVHRRFAHQDFVQHNEVGGFIIAVVGTLYAVVLGFLTVVVWQHFADARDLVAVESAAAADTWHTAIGLPIASRLRVRQDVNAYSEFMVDREWPEMRRGRVDVKADLILMDAITADGWFVPANLREGNSQSATMTQLGILHDDRQRRLNMNASGVSWFEWIVLLLGAVCVVCFCWLFGLRNARTHLLMTSAVTVVIVSLLVLLFELQYPFRSQVGVGPEAWSGVVSHIRLMQTGSQMQMRM
jgi:Protein of unknown function (DUF4239)